MKRICIFCDGTWNSADQASNGIPHPTNVLRMAYRVAKRHGQIDQVTLYDQGVGTGNPVDRFTGGAFGEGLVDNIYDAYRFLIANYEQGDEIFFFGFSRGAFTVRSLAGMIRKCGILKRTAVDRYRDALLLYRSSVHPDDPEAVAFRTENSLVGNHEIPIAFMGVWDTVGALGIPLRGLRWLTLHRHQFHDTELSKSVKRAYQALAIDEHRKPFEPAIWTYVPKRGQHVEQVWFCGAHSDVGGGYAERGLADITLQWMMEKATAAGLAFEDDALIALRLHADPMARIHDSMTRAYRLARPVQRVIGLTRPISGSWSRSPLVDKTQSVHSSVLERWDSDPTYRPPSLVAYFRRTGDVRANALAPAPAR